MAQAGPEAAMACGHFLRPCCSRTKFPCTAAMSLTSACCGSTVPGTDYSQAEVVPGTTRASEVA